MKRANNMNVLAAALMIALTITCSTTSVIAQQVTCSNALLQLLPCLTYLSKQTPSPSPQCCANVKQLNDQANTTPIRQQLCTCIKSAALAYHVDPPVAKALPGLCQVNVPVPIDPNVDCSKDFILSRC
ncbi:Non-specific lipid-transfer protein 4 [Linum perenne]